MRITIEVTGDSTPEQILRAADVLCQLAGQPRQKLSLSLGDITVSGDPEAVREYAEDAQPDPSRMGFGAETEAAAPPPPPPAAEEETEEPEEIPTETSALDADGLPWDPRIHAGTKAKVKDGTWRKRKNIDDSEYERVVAELRTAMGAPAAAAPPPPPPPPAAADAAPTPPPPPAVPAEGDTPTTFPALMSWLTKRMASQQLTANSVAEACAEVGLVDANGRGAMPMLQNRPDLIPRVCELLS